MVQSHDVLSVCIVIVRYDLCLDFPTEWPPESPVTITECQFLMCFAQKPMQQCLLDFGAPQSDATMVVEHATGPFGNVASKMHCKKT